MNLVLTEDGECRFSFDSCRFAWGEGFDIGPIGYQGSNGAGVEFRFAVVRGEKYYIRCADEFGNVPDRCSVEVMAV